MITAELVKELRDKTGAGMMDCKKALTETNGNVEEAVDWLREKGISKAEKKQSRIAAEGLANIFVNGNKAVVLEEGETLRGKVKNLDLYDVIITDESQFFTENQIEELRLLADNGYIVMCFGLKTDYMSRLFEGSKRLLEIADCIREVTTSCICGKKAVLNLKVDGFSVVKEGAQIDLGTEEKYLPMCHKCYAASFLSGHPVNCKNPNFLVD